MQTHHDVTFPLVVMGVFIAYIIGLVIWHHWKQQKGKH